MTKKKEAVKYGRGLAANTVQRVRNVLNALFNYAEAEKVSEDNPVRRTRIPPPPLSSVNPLTFEETWAFTSVKDRVWYGNALVFDLHTGLRPEELMALIWDDINFSAGTVRIERACIWIASSFRRFGPPKTRRSARIIELDPEHIEFLKLHREKLKQHTEEWKAIGRWQGEPKVKEWLQKNRPQQKHLYKDIDLVFPSRQGNVPGRQSPRKSFKLMLRYAGLTGDRLKVRWYDLRHTHATVLLTLGVPPHEVAARLGHTVAILNDRYTHVLPERQRSASSLFVSLIPISSSNASTRVEIQQHFTQFLSKLKENLESTLLNLLKE